MFTIQNKVLVCTSEGKSFPLNSPSITTPSFVYSGGVFNGNITTLQNALEAAGLSNTLIAFSVKSLCSPAMLKIAAKAKIGADCVSGKEIEIAIKAGIPTKKIVFAGVGKTDSEIALAVRNQILQINVESCEEVSVIDKIAQQIGKKAKISIRVNPQITSNAYTHERITTGREENKFGINITNLGEAISIIASSENVTLSGLSCHIGSQISCMKTFAESFQKLTDTALDISRSTNIQLETIDFGGGLGVKYHKDDPAPDVDQYAKAIATQVERLPKGICTIIEPGRYISAESGVLLTSVLYSKRSGSKNFIIVDAGINNILRIPLYGTSHEIIPVDLSGFEEFIPNVPENPLELTYLGNPQTYDIVGPICESTDILAANKPFPGVKRGDRLAIMVAGAYTSSMPLLYNSRPKAQEYLTHKGKLKKL